MSEAEPSTVADRLERDLAKRGRGSCAFCSFTVEGPMKDVIRQQIAHRQAAHGKKLNRDMLNRQRTTRHRAAKAEARQRHRDEQLAAIVAALREHDGPMKQAELARRLGGAKVTTGLDEGLKAGVLVKTPDGIVLAAA